MTEQRYPIHTLVLTSSEFKEDPITLRINYDDMKVLHPETEAFADEYTGTPLDMYELGYKCVEKHGDIWTWVYKPAASATPPAKRGRPKKTE